MMGISSDCKVWYQIGKKTVLEANLCQLENLIHLSSPKTYLKKKIKILLKRMYK